jgi:hypothetical protein
MVQIPLLFCLPSAGKGQGLCVHPSSQLPQSWFEPIFRPEVHIMRQPAKEKKMSTIHWIESFAEGLAEARKENKLVFADFFNPN